MPPHLGDAMLHVITLLPNLLGTVGRGVKALQEWAHQHPYIHVEVAAEVVELGISV